MRILLACERTGACRDEFRRAGHQAWSCDIEPGEGEFTQFHFKCDVREVLNFNWDMMIAFPPCQYLANSGSKHLYIGGKKANGRYEPRWTSMKEGADFFNLLRTAKIPRIAIENPVQHAHARVLIPKWAQTFQPWHFGHREVKRTCLWLKNLPKLTPTDILPPPYEAKCHMMAPSETRSADRAVTYPGVAKAMAAQWGSLGEKGLDQDRLFA